MNKKMVLNIISKIVMIEGFLLLLPVVVSLFYKEKDGYIFLILGLSVIVISYLLSLIKPKDMKFYTKEGLVVVSFIWIIWSLIGAIPFYVGGYMPSFVDAFFETVSGFTTTGSTVLNNIEALSKTMLFWRSFTHLIGGMGVLVFVLAIIPLTEGGSIYLLRAEVPGPTVGKLVPKAKKTSMILYEIYLFLVVLHIIFLLLGGMNFFDAMLHAFSTAGTGGFSTRNTSIKEFSPYIQYVISVFMFLFGINFNLYFYALIWNIKGIFKNEEFKLYLSLLVFSVVTITINIKNAMGFSLEEAFRAALFQVTSLMSTTGYYSYDFNLWPSYSKILLMLIIVVGACAGSTAGGLKVSRILMLLKEIKLFIKKQIHPRLVDIVTIDGKRVEDSTRYGALMFITLYCLICVISVILISLNNFDFEVTITSVLTTLGNAGPGLGKIGPIESFSKFSTFSKIVLSINMLIGRLEILPVVFLFNPTLWKKLKSNK